MVIYMPLSQCQILTKFAFYPKEYDKLSLLIRPTVSLLISTDAQWSMLLKQRYTQIECLINVCW